MARILSQALRRANLNPVAAPRALITHRHCSDQSGKTEVEFIEVEVDQSSSQEAASEVISSGIKRLEEAIHRIVVRRSAPDWLPFLPGYSYWVPPPNSNGIIRHPQGLIEVVENLATVGILNRGKPSDFLTEDETMSFSSARGWPSSTYFIKGASPIHPIPVMEVEVKNHGNVNNVRSTPTPEEEEG
ncbi:Hypothetical predicted protein [Olea europaea subsp. europaea]|uniref:Uncharacterized protein n=1 Tax=Olea europaea subsp. europaea TaxID=158383 RepID=A0A8S0UVB8_OLEEU|nr:Hypothetical predicted protein [Olea europaea subsp. europaea]